MLTPNNDPGQLCLETALKLHSMGLAPTCCNGKKPIITGWQNFSSQPLDRRDMELPEHKKLKPTTPEIIKDWWRQYPQGNVGVLCRELAHVDLDMIEAWPLIKTILPITPAIKQGARGLGFFYKPSAIDPIHRSRTFINRHTGECILEFLATGRQTVLPPSIHPFTGLPYYWVGCPEWEVLPMEGIDGLGALSVELSQNHLDQIEALLLAHGLIRAPRERGLALDGEMQDCDRVRYEAILRLRLPEHLEKARAAMAGGRQDAVNGCAYAMAKFIRVGMVDEKWLEGALRGISEDNGYISEHGSKRFMRDFTKAVDEGWSMPFSDLDAGSVGKLASAPIGVYCSPTGQAPEEEDEGFWAADLDEEITKGAPPQSWLVDKLIPKFEVSSIYGRGGLGKTTLVMQMLIAISRGERWLGYETEKSNVLFISGEDSRDDLVRMAQRLNGASPGRRCGTFAFQTLRDLKRKGFQCLGRTNRLTGDTDGTPLLESVRQFCIANKTQVIAIDPVGMVFAGNQNDLQAVYSFMSLLQKELCSLGITIILLCHPSKSGRKEGGDGTSGSVGWDSAPRSVLLLREADANQGDTDYCDLEQIKSSRGKNCPTIHLKRTHFGFVCVDVYEAKKAAQSTEGKAATVFMEILARRINSGERVSPRLASGQFELDDAAIRAKLDKRALEQARMRLIDAGSIIIVDQGPPSKRISLLTIPIKEQKPVSEH